MNEADKPIADSLPQPFPEGGEQEPSIPPQETSIAPQETPIAPPPGEAPVPTFAVVGHPNKGKSSIVATLARDDSVAIAAEPGTTTRARRYPMRVDDQVLYVLVDTPGFQRARRALAWMREHETTAAEHPRVVAQFVAEHRKTGQFTDECELLGSLLDGAGILYVVDGSKPFGEEYQAEMEILRWTGQPSMALINPIGQADHISQWEDALGQYFKVVRVFNAMTAEFEKRLELLRAFGQLRQAWRKPLERAVRVLEEDHGRRRRRSAAVLADMLVDMTTLSVERRLSSEEDPDRYKPELEEQYKDRLRHIEREGRKRIEEIYEHFSLKRREEGFDLADRDLFSQRAWLVFGLRRRDLIGAGAVGGAIVGGSIDAAVGGASLLIGTAIGAVVGGGMGWYSAGRLAEFKVVNRPLGGRLLRCGPTKNVNFPFVILGRARRHHAIVAGRTHAQRGELTLTDEHVKAGQGNPLTDDQRRMLQHCFARLRKSPDNPEVIGRGREELTNLIESILA